MPTDVLMPQMGESIAEGTIVRWIKKVGDKVDRDEPLFEISTDKVDAGIPSPAAGTVADIRVKKARPSPSTASSQPSRRPEKPSTRVGPAFRPGVLRISRLRARNPVRARVPLRCPRRTSGVPMTRKKRRRPPPKRATISGVADHSPGPQDRARAQHRHREPVRDGHQRPGDQG